MTGFTSLGFAIWVCTDGKDAEARLAEETRRGLAGLLSQIEVALADLPGVWIEDKEYAFAVHHAGVREPDAIRADGILAGIIEPCSEHFRVQCGKNVWEVLPKELEDKGAAVRQQLALLRGRSLAVYLGDDEVDEPAFAALPAGVTVHVGPPRRSRAQYRLSGVAEVRTFLQRLKAEFG